MTRKAKFPALFLSLAGILSGAPGDYMLLRYKGGTGGFASENFTPIPNYLLSFAADGSPMLVASPAGIVVGPASSTDNAVVRFDGITGTAIQNSTVTISDGGVLSANSINAMGGDYGVMVGSGNAITNLNANNLASGNVSVARLGSGGGTASASTFLRGDNQWVVPAGGTPGGASGQMQYNNAGAFGGTAQAVVAAGGYVKLTDPMIVNNIRDPDGWSVFNVAGAGGSPTNGFTVGNANPGSSPFFSVTGSDVNIDLGMYPKGTGALRVQTGRIKSPAVDFVISQTGGSLAVTQLVGASTATLNGVMVEELGLDSVDFGWKPLTGPQANVKLEHRTAQLMSSSSNPLGEFQLVWDVASSALKNWVFGQVQSAYSGTLLFGTQGAANQVPQNRDVGIARNAAGVLEINNGTAGTYRDLKLRTLTLAGGTTINISAPASASGLFLKDDGTWAAATRTGVRRTVYVNAGAMIPRATNGAAIGTTELGTNKIMFDSLDFDSGATEEAAGFWVTLPVVWDATNALTAKFHWTAASGTGTVKWDIVGRCYNDNDDIDQAFGTEATSGADTFLAANKMHVTATTGAFNPIGTVIGSRPIYFQVARDVATDTLNADARLLGVTIEYTESATEPAAQ
jgi:hypothetical protein